jgi:hypothetical protein
MAYTYSEAVTLNARISGKRWRRLNRSARGVRFAIFLISSRE